MPAQSIVLSLSDIAEDGRVLRHCRALTAAGYRVTALSIAPRSASHDAAAPPAADVHHLTIPPPDWSGARRLATGFALLRAKVVATEAQALESVCALPGVDDLRKALRGLARDCDPGATIVVANDWTSLPAALAAQSDFGIPFHYDSHEFALEEHCQNIVWSALFPKSIETLERLALARAMSVSCVSPGIAAAMAAHYALAQPPHVLMSVPDTAPLEPAPTNARREVLYHGLFNANRGLAALAAAAADWPQDWRLVLRGRANTPAAERSLRAAAVAGLAAGRVVIEPMVAQHQVIQSARASDIGIFLPDLGTRQNRFALPNKIFEYLFAGLVTVVPAATDMADLLARFDAGVYLDDPTPAGLRRWLSELTTDQLMAEKRRSRRAAERLYAGATTRTIATLIHAAQRH